MGKPPETVKQYRHLILLAIVCSWPGCKPKPPITNVEALMAARNYIIREHLHINPYDRPPAINFFKYLPDHAGPVWKVDFTRPVKNAPRTADGDVPVYGPIIWVRANGTVETNQWLSP
jgi:hypothetical protein